MPADHESTIYNIDDRLQLIEAKVQHFDEKIYQQGK